MFVQEEILSHLNDVDMHVMDGNSVYGMSGRFVFELQMDGIHWGS